MKRKEYILNLVCLLLALLVVLPGNSASAARASVKTASCYEYEDKVVGDYLDEPMRIASLTKLFSSYFLLRKRGADYKYETMFWVNSQNDLYIKGSHDPYFLEHGIFSIIKVLNQNEIYSVRDIYFNQDFMFHFSKNRKKIETKLKAYFATRKWKSTWIKGNSLSIAHQYKQVRELVAKGPKNSKNDSFDRNWPKSLKFSFRRLSRKSNHFASRFSKNIGAWIIKSSPLIEYVKILNSYSNNITTDEMVRQLGGASALESYINRELKVKTKLFTASGLNLGSGLIRKDNLATCRDVLKLTRALRGFIVKAGFSVSDLMPTAVADVGTLSQRFLDWDYAQNFVYKSGTLKQKPTSALVALHRGEKLTIVSLGQGGKRYISLKNREKDVLDQIINKIDLKYKRIPYVSKEFFMISSIQKTQ